MRSSFHALAIITISLAVTSPSLAQKKYGPGVTDTEIKLGQTMPYSGPVSPVSILGRVEAAYFTMINAAGGINGRKINMLSLDDGFSPPKTVEQTRKLVEDENVLGIVGTLGTPTNVSIAKYLNAKQVPHLFGASATPKLDDAKNLPWSTTFYTSLVTESNVYAQYILKTKPDAKIGILYQNDDYGKGYLNTFKAALGDKAATMVIKEVSYEVSDPTVDSQIISLQASGADTFFQASQNKFAAQAIRKTYDLGWKPLQIIITGVSQISSTLRPAGLERATGVLTSLFMKPPGDPAWDNDKDMIDYYAFMKKWAPNENPEDSTGALGYTTAEMIVEVLKRCGDDLTRENLLYQATHVKDLQLPLFISGVKIDITPESRVAWHQAQMARFDGTKWVFIGDVITVASSK